MSGFVYLWFDRRDGRFYLGSHWGTPDDGYVAGCRAMLREYRKRPQDFKRRIIEVVSKSRADLLIAERRWLQMISPTELRSRYYNAFRSVGRQWYVDEKERAIVGRKLAGIHRRTGDLTLDRLKALLDYNPATGEWRWRVDQPNGSKAGALAGWVLESKRKNSKPYRTRKIMLFQRTYTAARLAWFYMTATWPDRIVDHRNTDSLDDKWGNLRLANESQNKLNSPVRSDSRSGIKGVYYDPRRKKWVAQAGADGSRRFLGRFASAAEARAAYQAAACQMHGEFFRGE